MQYVVPNHLDELNQQQQKSRLSPEFLGRARSLHSVILVLLKAVALLNRFSVAFRIFKCVLRLFRVVYE